MRTAETGTRAEKILCRALRSREAGLVTVELALILPTVFFLLIGALTLGHALYVRHELARQAATLVRASVLAGRTRDADREADAVKALSDAAASWQRSCGAGQGMGRPGVRATSWEPHTKVRVARLEITCPYVGIIAGDMLSRRGLTIKELSGSAELAFRR